MAQLMAAPLVGGQRSEVIDLIKELEIKADGDSSGRMVYYPIKDTRLQQQFKRILGITGEIPNAENSKMSTEKVALRRDLLGQVWLVLDNSQERICPKCGTPIRMVSYLGDLVSDCECPSQIDSVRERFSTNMR